MPLNDREKEILSWVAAGKTASETGAILAVSGRTVEWHLNRIVDKLDVANRVEAVATALRRGIIPTFISTGTGVTAYVSGLVDDLFPGLFTLPGILT